MGMASQLGSGGRWPIDGCRGLAVRYKGCRILRSLKTLLGELLSIMLRHKLGFSSFRNSLRRILHKRGPHLLLFLTAPESPKMLDIQILSKELRKFEHLFIGFDIVKIFSLLEDICKSI